MTYWGQKERRHTTKVKFTGGNTDSAAGFPETVVLLEASCHRQHHLFFIRRRRWRRELIVERRGDVREYFIAEGSEDAGFGNPKSSGTGLTPGCSYQRLSRLSEMLHKEQAPFSPLPPQHEHYQLLTKYNLFATMPASRQRQSEGCPSSQGSAALPLTPRALRLKGGR